MDPKDYFLSSLLDWYAQNKRQLPWRETTDPYKIWLSEIILQQTQVKQGLPYYLHFVSTYPTVKDLAEASEDQIMKSWEGLGYYSRARNLMYTAREIYFNRKGVFPTTAKELKELKGIGDYTSAAISSFANEEAVPVVDGNVFRLVSRYFDLENDISKAKTKAIFSNLLQGIIDKAKPSTFNNAIMEFGAIHCKAKNPDCKECVLQDHCLALSRQCVDKRPFNSKKIKKKTIYLNYFVHDGDEQWIRRRDVTGIWPSLYELPGYESEDNQLIQKHKEHEIQNMELIKELTHQLTHRTLKVKFWLLNIEEAKWIDRSTYRQVSIQELKSLSFPKVFHWIYSYF